MSFDDAQDDVLATLAAFNGLLTDYPKSDDWRSVRQVGEGLIYALVARGQDSGYTSKEMADTLGIEVDDVHRPIAEHQTDQATLVADEHGIVRTVT